MFYQKYQITRADGSPVELEEDEIIFALRLRDPAGEAALLAYAAATRNKDLRDFLFSKIRAWRRKDISAILSGTQGSSGSEARRNRGVKTKLLLEEGDSRVTAILVIERDPFETPNEITTPVK